MTETPIETPVTAPVTPPPPVIARRGGTPLWLTLLLLVLQAGGLYAVFRHRPPADDARIAALEAALTATQLHLAQLEQRPQPDLSLLVAPVAGRLTVVEAAIRGLAERPAPNAVDVAASLAPLEGRVSALEKKSGQDVAAPIAAASQALGARIDALDARVTAALARVSAAATAATRLNAVMQALDNGQKLGDIPGAPPPLARFANVAPPTEAGLRLRFAAAASAAEVASRPSADSGGFFQRMWDRAQGMVTVSRAGHVLIGAPASVDLADARLKLEAGDLAGAVAALAHLDPAAAAAMAGWRGDAQALLDARAALAAMAKS